MAKNNNDYAAQKKTLLAQKEEIVQLMDTRDEATEIVNLDQSRIGRVSRMETMQSQEMALEANRRRAEHLKQIEHALQKIDDGEYGTCEECGEEIQEKRLEFDRAAILCIACAEKAEQADADL